jgi:hypothetical protein
VLLYFTLVEVVVVLLLVLPSHLLTRLVETAVVETEGILIISLLLREQMDEVAVVVVEETRLVLRVRLVVRV